MFPIVDDVYDTRNTRVKVSHPIQFTTFNVLNPQWTCYNDQHHDGSGPGGCEPVAWSARRHRLNADCIEKSIQPDVLAVQEAGLDTSFPGYMCVSFCEMDCGSGTALFVKKDGLYGETLREIGYDTVGEFRECGPSEGRNMVVVYYDDGTYDCEKIDNWFETDPARKGSFCPTGKIIAVGVPCISSSTHFFATALQFCGTVFVSGHFDGGMGPHNKLVRASQMHAIGRVHRKVWGVGSPIVLGCDSNTEDVTDFKAPLAKYNIMEIPYTGMTGFNSQLTEPRQLDRIYVSVGLPHGAASPFLAAPQNPFKEEATIGSDHVPVSVSVTTKEYCAVY